MNKNDLKKLKAFLQTIDKPEAKKFVDKIEKELKPITVASRKAKGRNLQQYVCQLLSDWTGIPWGEDELIQSRGMGQHGVDVMLLGDARSTIPYDIECKNTENLNLTGTIQQAKDNTKEGRVWLIVHKKNGMPDPIAIMDLKTLIEMTVRPKTVMRSKDD